jgi:hypothetical protein
VRFEQLDRRIDGMVPRLGGMIVATWHPDRDQIFRLRLDRAMGCTAPKG